MNDLLYGVGALDPATFVGVGALLAAVASLACWVPADRASRLDPTLVLKGE
jgi:putative ABC transport system permease protein